jgi:peptidoglycan/LPS O-acetylase OafA/YrhL
MLIHHLTGWLTGIDARDVLPGWPEFAVTDVAAPAFFVAAGMSAALFVASRRRRGVPGWRIAGLLVRRYGLLVPIGVALRWSLGREPVDFGVLEALGVTVLIGALVIAVVPARFRWLTAISALVVGSALAVTITAPDGSFVAEVVDGKFPVVTYAGFVLVGMVAVTSGAYADRRWITTATLVSVFGVIALMADGVVPQRYPGELPFVIPGLAGTVLIYAASQRCWPALLAPLDKLLRPAAAHTLGIFLAHYALFEWLRARGINGSIDARMAVPAAFAITIVLCLIAPRIPQLPWSPRTGWRRRPQPAQQAQQAKPAGHEGEDDRDDGVDQRPAIEPSPTLAPVGATAGTSSAGGAASLRTIPRKNGSEKPAANP